MSYSSLSFAPDFTINVGRMNAPRITLSAVGDAAQLDFVTNVAGSQNYSFFAARVTGGGLTSGQLTLFSYNSSLSPTAQIMQILPQSDTVSPTINFYGYLSAYHYRVGNIAGAFTTDQVQLSGAGSIVVPTTAVSAGSTVLVSYLNNANPVIPLSVSIINNVSFTVTGDISQVFCYLIVN